MYYHCRLAALAALLLTGVLVGRAPAFAQHNLQEGVQDLVRQMMTSMQQQQKRKLAILDFSRLDGSIDNFGRYLSERLVTSMFLTSRFQVVERRQLDKILTELKLNASDLIDPQNAQRLGRVYGVDAIATGSVSELAAAVEVNARLIETETGQVFAVASTQFAKSQDVAALIGSGRATGLSPVALAAPSPTVDWRQFKYVHKAFALEVTRVEAVRDKITVTLEYTNRIGAPQRARPDTKGRYNWLSGGVYRPTYLVDNLGRRFVPPDAVAEEKAFPSEVPQILVLTLDKFERGGSHAKLVLHWVYQERPYECCAEVDVVIENIPLPQ